MKLFTFFSGLAALTILLMAASCNKDVISNVSPADEPIESNPTGGKIVFGGETMGLSTKAYVESKEDGLKANGFNVAGVLGTASVFNEAASWNSASSWYATANDYYWPSIGNMDFYAVYPSSQVISLASGVATLVYSQNPDTDLLAAKKNSVAKQTSSVALSFDHILSLIRIKATGKDVSGVVYKVTKVSVTSPTGGTYAYADGSWTALTATASGVYSSASTTLSGTTDISGGMTVVPCKPAIAVEYSVYQADGTTLIASYSKSGTLAAALEQGKETTITVSLPNDNASNITFTVRVNPWGSAVASLDL